MLPQVLEFSANGGDMRAKYIYYTPPASTAFIFGIVPVYHSELTTCQVNSMLSWRCIALDFGAQLLFALVRSIFKPSLVHYTHHMIIDILDSTCWTALHYFTSGTIFQSLVFQSYRHFCVRTTRCHHARRIVKRITNKALFG